MSRSYSILRIVLLISLCWCADLFAQVDRYLHFDGLNDHVQVNNSSSFNFAGDFTLEVWFRPQRLNKRGDLVGKKELVPGAPSQNDVAIFLDNSNLLVGYLKNSSTPLVLFSSTVVNDTSIWYHASLRRSGTNISLLVNGVVESSGTYSGNLTSNGPFRIGANRVDSASSPTGSPRNAYSGYIDEVRVWTYARSNTQIQAYRNMELTGNEPNLAAYYNFNVGVPCYNNASELYLPDVSGNMNTGTLVYFALSGSGPTPCRSNWNGPGCVPSGSTISVTECNQYVSPAGNIYTATGTYYDTLVSASLCDSIITIHLTIGSLNTAVIQLSRTLQAVTAFINYQWLDCGNGNVPIPGAINQTFTPTVSGTYSVELSNGSCVDTSSCYDVYVTGISDQASFREISLWPNPNRGRFIIRASGEFKSPLQLVVFDITGKEIQRFDRISAGDNELSLNLSSGVYLLKLFNEEFSETRRMVVSY